MKQSDTNIFSAELSSKPRRRLRVSDKRVERTAERVDIAKDRVRFSAPLIARRADGFCISLPRLRFALIRLVHCESAVAVFECAHDATSAHPCAIA